MWTNAKKHPAASIVASVVLAIASAAHAATPDIPDLGADTPKALLESIVKVVSDKTNPQGWLGFEPPANRDLSKKILESALQLRDKTTIVAQLVQSKIGKMEADIVRQTTGAGVQPGVEVTLANQIVVAIAADGEINWDQTKIIENGDTARIPNGFGQDLAMVKVNGKWYLGEGVPPVKETLAMDAPGNKQMTDQLMNFLVQLEQKINAGQITRANFMQEYSNLINESMSAPTTPAQ